MRKNKILILMIALIMVIVAGCNTRQMRLNRTQTRLGVERPNTLTRRDNLNRPNINPNQDTRTNDNRRTNEDRMPDSVGRDIDIGGNIDTNIVNDPTRDTRNLDIIARSNYLAKKVKELNEIDDATVILTENTALVGVKIKGNVKGEMTTDLKRNVENKIKNTDNRIKNVAVTANPDLATRLRDIMFDIERGRPLSGFAVEIKEILKRITPVK